MERGTVYRGIHRGMDTKISVVEYPEGRVYRGTNRGKLKKNSITSAVIANRLVIAIRASRHATIARQSTTGRHSTTAVSFYHNRLSTTAVFLPWPSFHHGRQSTMGRHSTTDVIPPRPPINYGRHSTTAIIPPRPPFHYGRHSTRPPFHYGRHSTRPPFHYGRHSTTVFFFLVLMAIINFPFFLRPFFLLREYLPLQRSGK